VADPGADLAAACAEEGIAVHPIPGPSAAAAAVAMAGIPVDEGFTFVGFLPPKSGARRKKLEKLKPIAGSLVAFVPPHKLVSTLTDAAEVLGDRNCCVCREMTKVRTTTVLFIYPRLLSGCWFSSFGFFSRRESGDDYANYVP
jgi:16S rRNA (cytidine1402-2'-O)-methyltransferase